MNMIIAHAEEHTSVVQEYLDLLSDPAHLLLELTIILVVDVLVLALLWPFVIKPLANHWLAGSLRKRDAAHGHDHE